MIITLDCGSCLKCEKQLWGSFYPGEEWKLPHFKNAVFQRENVWFIDVCPFHDGEGCTIHEEPWRPLQCQMYPCYLNYDGEVEVDFELCPNAHQVDEEFKAHVKAKFNQLNLGPEEFRRWGKIVAKYCEPAKQAKKNSCP
jgi:Fe-S-cluster containining protein